MRRWTHLAALCSCIALLIVVLGGCGRRGVSERPERIAIAVNDWTPSASLYVADEKGYFKDEGLDVTFQSHASGRLAFTATMSGKADFATVADTPIAGAALHGEPFVVVATICKIDNPDFIIARRDRGISTATDLRGKKIGLAKGTTADFFLHAYLTTRYIDPKEVRLVDMPPDRVVDALLSGEVDAVCTWTRYADVLQSKLGRQALILTDRDIYTMSWVLAAKKQSVQRHPESVKKLLRAVIRADRFIEDHPVQARAIIARRTVTNPALLKQRWETYTFETVLDQSLIENVEDQANWMLGEETKGTDKFPNILEFVYTNGLKEVRPEAVTIPGR